MTNILHHYSFSLFREILTDAKLDKYLDRLKSYHLETYEHSARVSLLSTDVGIDNSLPDCDLRILSYGGLLHDIGKLGISLELLSKQSALEPSERCIISQHPRLGFIYLEDFNQDVRKIVVGHHEWKKDPYPRKTHRQNEDERIQNLTQIVAACDIYDALASKRSYKDPMKKEEIEKIMLEQYKGDQKYVEQVLLRY